MSENKTDYLNEKEHLEKLRQQAERVLDISPQQLQDMSPEQVSRLVHDFQVQQIELEMQYQELRVIEEQLREAFDRYHSLFHTAPIGYFTLDRDGIIHEVNNTFVQLFRQQVDAFVNRPFYKLVSPESQNPFFIFMRQAFQHKSFPDLELRLQRYDGTTFYGLLQANWEIEDDTTNLARVTIIDISSRKKAEQALKQKKEEWEKTFHAVGDGIVILDPELKVVRINPATSAITTLSEKEILGQTCYKLFSGEDSSCHNCPGVDQNRLHPGCNCEIENKKLGKIFQVSISPLFNSERDQENYVCIAKDITEKKMNEAVLEQTRKMEAIGTLAGGIAHDFNNILSVIIGCCELSQMHLKKGSTKGIEHDIETIRDAGMRARDLVAQILTFSRKSNKNKKSILLTPLVVDSLKLLRSTLPASIKMEKQIAPDNLAVLVDPVQIQQILINLASNAEHAMRKGGGTLTISLYRDDLNSQRRFFNETLEAGPYVCLSVEDTGHGMDRETLRRATEPFFTTKEVGEGTGMGLSIIDGAVKELGGAIDIVSETGKGTKISLYLPCITDVHMKLNRQKEEVVLPVQPASSSKKQVLFVDDEDMICELAERILKFLGYKPTCLRDSVTALHLFKDDPHRFNIVITDQTMPMLPGSELAREILQIRPEMPIILCTGYSSTINEAQAKEIGIRSFMLKPISIDALTAAIHTALA